MRLAVCLPNRLPKSNPYQGRFSSGGSAHDQLKSAMQLLAVVEQDGRGIGSRALDGAKLSYPAHIRLAVPHFQKDIGIFNQFRGRIGCPHDPNG